MQVVLMTQRNFRSIEFIAFTLENVDDSYDKNPQQIIEKYSRTILSD